MKIGEHINIERTLSGLYKVELPDGTFLVGGAASTACVLSQAIFKDEACEVDEVFLAKRMAELAQKGVQ